MKAIPGLRAALMGASALAGSLVVGSVAQAQDQTPEAVPPAVEEVVVTGSRIRRDEYTSASPIEIITRSEALLAGAASTTEILQGSTVTSGAAQIDNAFTGYVTEGGPGANTVNLRGLGAIRTLVLLNGRRLAPAGSRGQVGPADVNVLPSSMVDRIEILKDGASSIYGSDAVAGVVNIITRTDMDGSTVEAFTDQTFEGGGAQYRVSGAWGKTFDKGHITASLEYIDAQRLQRKDRDWASCPTDYLRDPTTGEYVGELNPDGSIRCFPLLSDQSQGIAQNYIVSYGGLFDPDPDVVPVFFANRFTPVPGLPAGGGDLDGFQLVNNVNLRPTFAKGQLNEDIYSPVKAWTFFSTGAYDIGVLGGAEVYGEFLYSHRESNQIGSRQLSLDPLGPNVLGYYNGLDAAGYPTSPFFPTALAAEGYQALNPLVYFGNDRASQEVQFYRASAGIRGNLPWKNWKYDVNLMYSKSKAEYAFDVFITERLRQSLDVIEAPVGTPADLVIVAPTGSLKAGGSYTCASNIGNPNARCVPMNLLTDEAMAGNVPANLRDWLSDTIRGETEYEQITTQAIIDGDLFELPAGTVGAAFGVELRWDKLNDVPPLESQNGEVYNFSTAGITKGEDNVWEVFGELNIPLLRDLPGIKKLELSLSDRYTNYDSYGSNNTYKIGANWTVTDWLKLRGTYGTSFRAPGLYEQYLAEQSGFYGSGVDPCNDFAQLQDGSVVKANCRAELEAILGPGPQVENFIATAGPEVFSGGGGKDLNAETSTAKTVGFVIQPSFIDLSFAMDYFDITIEDQIAQYGQNILTLCYNDPDFRAGGGLCDLIAPRDGVGNLVSFRDPYVNIATQRVEGLDFNVRYRRDIGPGKLTADFRWTHLITQNFKLFAGEETTDTNGLLGSPKNVGDLDLRYDVRDWVFRYGLTYIGEMDSNAYLGVDPSVDPYDFQVDPYYRHDIAVQYSFKNDLEIIVGVNNLTDAEGGKVSSGYVGAYRVGDRFNYSGYDVRGRSWFINVTKSF